ncbi:MAG: hypothetical protein WA003_06880 [Desulfuromonadaceae bacterium]
MSTEIDFEKLKWLISCPSGDANFKNQLAGANETTIRTALARIDDNEVTKKKALEIGLKKLLQGAVSVLAETNNHHTGVLAMDAATYEAEREDDKSRQIQQTEREGMIAKCFEVIGQIKGVQMLTKFGDVASLVWLKQVKESKIYRDVPGIGTWDKFCESIGKSRRHIDEDLLNLQVFGEEFLGYVSGLGVGYRELKQLRQLTHDGSVIIDGDCLTIENESIPIDQDHAEELQAAIERIINDRQQINSRVEKLEKQFKSAVDEETKGLKLEKKTLLKEVERLKPFDPEEKDRSFASAQMSAIQDATLELVTQMSKFIVRPDVTDDPVIMGQVEGHMQTAELALKDLRSRWEDTVNLFEA